MPLRSGRPWATAGTAGRVGGVGGRGTDLSLGWPGVFPNGSTALADLEYGNCRIAGFEPESALNTPDTIDFTQWIPLFPLPNVVLLPGGILPLHVFEPRYRVMTHDALAGAQLIATALLKPGQESRYHTLHVDIQQVVCIGHILRDEQLWDGRYDFLLQGLNRAVVLEENRGRPYRRARLQPLFPKSLEPGAERACREALRRLSSEPSLARLTAELNWPELIDCPNLSLSHLLDVLASVVLTTVGDRQHFLTEPCAQRRAGYLCGVLRAMSAGQREQVCQSKRGRPWPRLCPSN